MTLYIPLSDLMSGSAVTDRRVCRRAGEGINLSRLRTDVAHNASRLEQRVTTGAKVLLSCSDTYWFVVGMWASLHAGARLVLPPNAQPGTLAEFRTDVALTICDRGSCDSENFFESEHGDRGRDLAPLVAAECRLDFFSSGSSGQPKCISKTLQQLEVEVQNLEVMLGDDMGPGTVVSTVSHLHIYGLTFGVLWPMAAGRPFDTETYRIWEALVPTLDAAPIIVSSPAHLSRIPGGIGLQRRVKPRAVLSAGAPLPWPAAQQTFETFGRWPLEIYGSTETGGIAYRQRTRDDTSWTPFDGVETRPGAGGVLSIRSIYLTDDKWHDLDDLVEFEPDQTFRLKGRADRVAKIEGKRVSLAEVEARIAALADFSDVVAVAMGGQRAIVGVVAVLTETGQRRLTDIGSFRFGRYVNAKLRHYLEPTTLPKRWRFVDRIPVNVQGKRIDGEIREVLENAQPTPRTGPEIRAIRRENDTLEIDMLIPGDLLYFQGHFPDQPVLPGIVQLEWAIAEARRNFDQAGAVLQVRNLKYRRLIRPDTDVTLSLQFHASDGRVSFEFRDDDTVYSSGRFTFTDA